MKGFTGLECGGFDDENLGNGTQDGNEVPSIFSQTPRTLRVKAQFLDLIDRGITVGFSATPQYESDQLTGRTLRVSQSAPQAEFVDLVDAPEAHTGFTFLGALGAEGMITGSAPQSLIEEMPQPPQEGGIN